MADALPLIPSPGTIPAADALEAAISDALGGTTDPGGAETPIPLGYTWRIDPDAGRLVRAGGSPRPAVGVDALKAWILTVLYTARGAHRYVPARIGVESPEGPLGRAQVAELLADLEAGIKTALLVHDRITAVDVDVTFDPSVGVVYLTTLDVTVDDESILSVPNVQLNPEGN